MISVQNITIYEINRLPLIIFSACLYALPFLFTDCAWWIIFLFLVPLFYAAVTTSVRFIDGYLWGVITISLHMTGVFQGIFHMAEGPVWQKLIPIVFIVTTQALYAGVWFWITQKLITVMRLHNYFAHLAIWVLTTWAYFLFLDHAWMWAYDVIEGYQLLNPLVPLAIYPALYGFLPVCGREILLVLLILTQAAIVYVIIARCWQSILLLTIMGAFWMLSIVTASVQETKKPAWFTRIAGIKTSFYHPCDLLELAQHIQFHCKGILDKNPEVDCILFPESAVYCEQLATVPEMVELFSHKYLGKSVQLVVGAFHWEYPEYRNALHYIVDGKVIDIFNKRHAMALTERVPQCIAWYGTMKELYFKTRSPVTPSHNIRPLWDFGNGLRGVPYICSELFFQHTTDDAYPQEMIIACCNDSWAWAQSLKYLMLLGARMKACEWQRDIMYVTFAYTVLLKKDGSIFSCVAED